MTDHEYAPTPPKIDQLSFTRFMFAVIIVAAHFGEELWPWWNQKLWWIVQQAYFGPSYFFVLSGFVMLIAYGQKPKLNALDYFKNRFARIYPVYLLGLLLMLALTVSQAATVPGDVVLSVLALQSWIPGKALVFNFPSWSLSVEFFLYAIFPFLFNRFYAKRKWTTLIAPVFIIWLVTQVVFHWYLAAGYDKGSPAPSHDLGFHFPLMHLSAFLIGNVAGLAYNQTYRDKQRNFDLHILVAFAILFLACEFPMGLNNQDGLYSPLLALLVVLLSLNTGFVTTVFKLKPLVFLGDIAYGVYILQVPVYLFTRELLRALGMKDASMRYWVTFAVLIALASASYIWIEAPLRNRIKKWKIPRLRSPLSAA